MKGNDAVLDHLQRLLANELAAVDQYFIHSRMYEDWGLYELATRIEHEREEEVGHADILIKRMLFLERIPDMSQRDGLNIGTDVPACLKSDLDLELAVDVALKDAIACCEEHHDYQTREHLLQLLSDTEEDHIWWLEKQLRLIDTIGLQNYLQAKMGDEPQH